MTSSITALYAAPLALLAVGLAIRVTVLRNKTDISLGDGGSSELLVAIRRHGNLAENLPLALLLMAMNEGLGLGPVWLHLAGAGLLAARLIHPFGLGDGSPLIARVVGMVGTWAVLAGLSVALVSQAF